MNSEIKLRAHIYNLLNPGDHRDRLSHAVNVFIIALILINVLAASLETVDGFYEAYKPFFSSVEIFSVGIFTIEYILRFWSTIEAKDHKTRFKFLFSFNSIIDLLAIAPFYLGFIFGIDLRALVALRLLRLLKLVRYFQPLEILGAVMKAEFRAFMTAMFVLMILVFVASTGIYFFEHDAQPDVFGSIPESMWWAIVTLTTLGYGDVIPITAPGRIFAAVITILSIGTVALPTGMLASRFSEELKKRKNDMNQHIANFVADGELPVEDIKQLEEIRNKLCLSEDDMQKLLARQLDSKGECPLCGKANE